MIDIKKYELSTTGICAPVVVATWGGIKGDIENQQDLVDYVASHGGGGAEWGSITGVLSDQTDLMSYMSSFATMSWVEAQGYLTEHQSLEGYATESWVSSQGYLTSTALTGYATESWVSSQGYLTSVPSGYATEQWVGQQGYLTQDNLSSYATQDWVWQQGFMDYYTASSMIGEVEDNVKSWVIGQSYYQNDGTLDPLIHREELGGGYLKYNCILHGNALNWKTFSAAPTQTQTGKFVYKLNGEVYGFDPSSSKMYVWDQKTCEFVFYANTSGHNIEQYPLWNDNDGNVFFGNAYTVDLYMKDDKTQVTFTPHSMGGTYQKYQWSMDNICRRGGNIYMIVRDQYADDGTGTAYVYNPLTMEFDSSIPCTGIPENSWWRYTNDYENTTFYTRNGSMYYPEEYYDKDLDAITSIFFTPASAFPTTFTYQGDSYNIVGNRCIQYNNNVFFYIESSTKMLFKYDLGNPSLGWVPYGGSSSSLPFDIEPGITVRDTGVFDDVNNVMFGFCSKSGKTGQIGVWNLGQTVEEYGWDNTVDSRLDAIESSLDSALSITNEILS